jgi:hypothetical protein
LVKTASAVTTKTPLSQTGRAGELGHKALSPDSNALLGPEVERNESNLLAKIADIFGGKDPVWAEQIKIAMRSYFRPSENRNPAALPWNLGMVSARLTA